VTLLKHEELEEALGHPDLAERLVVMPLLDLDEQLGPASIDVRLGTQFQTLRRSVGSGVDPGGEDLQEMVEQSHQPVTVRYGDPFWLHPGQFVLGTTLEFVQLPAHLGAYVVGRSTWGRLGLVVATAIMVQPGWKGNLTLELVNEGEGPIALYAGSRVAQLAIHSLQSPTSHPYEGRYAGPTGPWAPVLQKEGNEIKRLRQIAGHLDPGCKAK
jgi:dCTP deaminase